MTAESSLARAGSGILEPSTFPHPAFTAGALACARFQWVGAARRCRRSTAFPGEVGRGHRIHPRRRGALRGVALDHVGDLAHGGRAVSAVYVVSGLLALGLFVYLLYAMFKPERF